MFIDKVYVSKNKREVSVKILKILLLYLLTLYIDKGIKIFKLRSDWSYGNKIDKNNFETCLSCYYEKLGFSVYEDEFQEIPIKPYVDFYKTKLHSKYKNSKMCLLCDCQRFLKVNKYNNLDFTKIKPDMNSSVLNLMRSLKNALKDMNCL